MRTRVATGAVVAAAAVVAVLAVVLHGGPKAHPKQQLASWKTTPAVAATFLRDSYGPGQTASFVLWKPAADLTLQIYRMAPTDPGWNRTTMTGVPVSSVYRFGAVPAHTPRSLLVGETWPSGMYFAKLQAGGLTGFAPFVVRPYTLGQHRVLIVMPTYTWQAYNFRDDNGDGRGDTWYDSSTTRTVRLDRPFLARGMPPHFTTYDLPFLAWMAENHRQADFISDTDLGSLPGGARALQRAYALVIFPGHHEYITPSEYANVTGYRNLGGHLMFLCANDFFWRVVRHGYTITRTEQWRRLGRPEASLIGVQYMGNDRGGRQGPWRVVTTTRAPWLFADTKLRAGSPFGMGGVEIDHLAASSPPGTAVVADIPNLMGPGFTAQMTYYTTPGGAEVFAAGAFTLAGSRDAVSHQVLTNLWRHLA